MRSRITTLTSTNAVRTDETRNSPDTADAYLPYMRQITLSCGLGLMSWAFFLGRRGRRRQAVRREREE
jgi:hypothetical protein